jgi:hypothetical protein
VIGAVVGLLAAALGVGCGAEDYSPADLQLDVSAAVPADAETLRVCVSGRGVHEQGAGNGRAAVTGLAADGSLIVQVEVLDEAGSLIGQTAPVVLDDDDPWAEVPLAASDTPCSADGAPAPDGSATRLLAVRFEEWLQ